MAVSRTLRPRIFCCYRGLCLPERSRYGAKDFATGIRKMTQYYTREDQNRQRDSVEKMAEGLKSRVVPIRKGA
jgi:hypothetical protein